MRQRGQDTIQRCGERAGRHGGPDRQAEEAATEEWLDAILHRALELGVGDAEPTPTVWVTIRETLEVRSQHTPTGGEE
jgi:hypothetical protein